MTKFLIDLSIASKRFICEIKAAKQTTLEIGQGTVAEIGKSESERERECEGERERERPWTELRK